MLSINVKSGDKVVFAYPDNSASPIVRKNAKVLSIGKTYTVKNIWKTKDSTLISLEGYGEKWFPSVMFTDMDIN